VGRLGRIAFLILLCGPAFGVGRAATQGLSWPPDVDLYRDVAQAQTMADGSPLADPFYRGETLWYNPLVPGLVAAFSRLSGEPVNVLYARAGAYLNLLAPIAFFLLIDACFGLPAAVLATLHLVYLRDPAGPPWLSPAYSPWLYSAAFVPALFYATVLAYRRALAAGERRWFVAAGVLLGLTFLGHTAPALLAAVLAAVGFGGEVWAGRGRGSFPRHLLLVAAAAITAAPFLSSILVRYGLRIRNPAPLEWVWPPMTLPNLAGFVATYVSLPAMGAAVVALAWLLRREPRRREASLLAGWAIAAAVLFGLSLLREATGLGPRLVPRHHFLLYWRAAESALLGYGAAALLGAFAWPRVPRGLRPAASLAAVAAVIAFVLPSYRERDAFRAGRRDAEREDSRANRQEARDWIRAHSAPDDVFLAADDLALMVVGPAGRKTLALDAYFSNPYVDWRARHEEREALVQDLRERRISAFLEGARAHGIVFVIHKRSDRWGPDGIPALAQEFANARIAIYRVLIPAPDGHIRGSMAPQADLGTARSSRTYRIPGPFRRVRTASGPSSSVMIMANGAPKNMEPLIPSRIAFSRT